MGKLNRYLKLELMIGLTLLFNGFVLSAQECEQPSYCDRLCWSPEGNHPAQTNPVLTTPSHVIVHHSGDNLVWPVGTDFKLVVQAYWDQHVNSNGWADIGYNWLIDRNGVIYEGRGDGVRGAHFSCMNQSTTGICLIGNFELEVPSAAALNKLKDLTAWEASDKDLDILTASRHTSSQLNLFQLSGHRDGNPSPAPQSCANGTVCPGENLYSLLPFLRTDVGNYQCYNGNPDALNCADAIQLNCGVMYSGGASTDSSQVFSYACNNWTETGPERVHMITPTVDGLLKAELSGFSGDLDVYILGSCDPSDCLGSVSSSAAIYEEAKAGQPYLVVVDSDDGSGGSYELLVTCSTSVETENLALGSLITVFPNPVNNWLNYRLPSHIKLKRIEIINSLGQVQRVLGNEGIIDVNHLPAGTYFIRFTDQFKKTANFKWVKN